MAIDILPEVVQLQEGETLPLFSLLPRAAIVQQKRMSILGESILSSVFIKSSDPGMTLDVRYFDTTTGDEVDGERFELTSHQQFTPANVGETHRILVTRIHNKPVCEITVAGPGTITFGVYVSVRSETAADLNLFLDGEAAVLTEDRGQPVMCYDEAADTFNFLRCPLTVTIEEAGTPFYRDGIALPSTPGSEEVLDSFTVPALTTRKMHRVQISSNHPGKWTLKAGATTIATGRVQPGQPDSIFQFDPRRSITASTLVELRYCAISGRIASDVDWHIMGSDFT